MIAEGVAAGYQYVLDLAGRESPPVIDLALVRELHRRSFGHLYDWAGKWRMVELDWPLGTSPPAYVIERMEGFVDDLATRLDYLPMPDDPRYRDAVGQLIAWFQHRYVEIHPFRDFNGRTARMLSTYLLLLLGLPYVEIQAEEGADRDAYIGAMRAADEHDLRPLQELILTALEEAERLPAEGNT